jgi:hypothetical protein
VAQQTTLTYFLAKLFAKIIPNINMPVKERLFQKYIENYESTVYPGVVM